MRFGPFLNIPSPEKVRVCTPRLVSGAKNIENGAGMGKNMLIRAKNTEFGAREGKNQAFGAKNPKNGADERKTSYYYAGKSAE